MASVAFLTDSNSLAAYYQQVDSLIAPIEENIPKTKELIRCRIATSGD